MQDSTRVDLSFKRFRLAVCVALCLSGVGGLTSLANAQSYSFADLGGGYASAINNSGQVVGTSAGNAVLWNGTTATILGVGSANDINNSGQVVGGSDGNAVLWNGTTATILGVGGAFAVNNSGQVVGTSFVPGQFAQATRWDGTTPTLLGKLYSRQSYAFGINDAGQVVGFSEDAGFGASHPTLWNSTTPTNLAPVVYYYGTSANDINNAGQVVGSLIHSGPPEQINSGTTHATLWNGTTASDLPGTFNGFSEARAINNLGQIVGQGAGPDTENCCTRHAILWDNGTSYDLNSFLEASTVASGWVLIAANDINDSGWIVGQAFNTITGANDAFLLSVSPAPEPEIYAMMLAGLGVLGWVGRRKTLQERAAA